METEVGIVMPVYYQKEEHVKAALHTILGQTHTDFMLCIVMDGAPEMLAFIEPLVRHDSRVHIISYEHNQGVAHALNTGFSYIYAIPSIRYVTWVSTDNLYYPHFLATLYHDITHAPPNVGIVYTCFHQIFEDGTLAHSQEFIEDMRKWQSRPKEDLLQGCIIGPAFIHRVEYCKDMDPYRFTLIQDYDYWLRMTDHCDIQFNPEVTMAYRLNSPFSLSTSIRTNPKYHRTCWNEVHQAHWETRQRRGIVPDLTIVYVVKNTTNDLFNNLSRLIDQYYTNYDLFLVNLSGVDIQQIVADEYNDRRIIVRDATKISRKQIIQDIAARCRTPYFMEASGTKKFLNEAILGQRMKEIKESAQVSPVCNRESFAIYRPVGGMGLRTYRVYPIAEAKWRLGI